MDTIPLPKHEVLNAEDAKKLIESYKISPVDLPRIRKGDPALEELTVKVGDIVKIIRKSPTAGQAIYYRIVVD